RAFVPAVAADGNLVAAAWGEEVSGGGGTTRAMLTSLDPTTARSSLDGGNALLIYNRAPAEISIAADAVSQNILIALIDVTTLAALYTIVDDDGGTQQLGTSACVDGGTCGPTTLMGPPGLLSVVLARAVAPTHTSLAQVIAWEEPTANFRYVNMSGSFPLPLPS